MKNCIISIFRPFPDKELGDDLDFATNGDLVLNNQLLDYCAIESNQNGDYFLELDTTDLTYESYLIHDNIIVVSDLPFVASEKEAFRIRDVSIEDGHITVKAWQLSYDLEECISLELDYEGGAEGAVNEYLSVTVPNPNLIINAESTLPETAFTSTKGNALNALNTMISSYGAKVDRNLRYITLRKRLGSDKEIRLEEGKNITTISKEEDWGDVVTTLLPMSTHGDGVYLSDNVNERFLHSEAESFYSRPIYKTIDFSPSDGIEDTIEAVREDLRKQAVAYLKAHSLPSFSYNISVELGENEAVSIGDTILCYLPKLSSDYISANVTKIVFDCLNGDYDSVTIGNVDNKSAYDYLQRAILLQQGVISNSLSSVENTVLAQGQELGTINGSITGINGSIDGINGSITSLNGTVESQGNILNTLKSATDFSFTKDADHCISLYQSGARKSGRFIVARLDITFQNLTKGMANTIATIPSELYPSENVVQNLITNNGQRVYAVITTDGKIQINPAVAITSDGIRDNILYIKKGAI